MTVNFDPSTPSTGPFPTDYLTAPDTTQKTGLVVRLPAPNCNSQPSDCAIVAALNQLDGFALQPQISVNFSNAIDPTTLQAGIVFVWLDNLTTDETGLGPIGQLTAINQVVYDPATNTAYAKPNDVFDQHRRYAIVVTDAVLDAAGNPVGPDPRFTACIQSPQNAYCALLHQLVGSLGGAALPGSIVAASVFTTMSATAWLEIARDLLPQVPVGFQPAGASIKTAGITAISLNAEVSDHPVAFQTAFTLHIPTDVSLAGVDRIVFGTYQSPNFLNAGQYIPITPSAAGVTRPAASAVSFHAYVPSSPMPAGGYPVVIFGHGFGEDSYLIPTLAASSLGQAGFATLAINAVGHGYGPQSTIEFVQQSNVMSSYAEGGRGVGLDGSGQISSTEGCFLSWPYPAGVRDCMRQTVVDLMQLESLVRSGTSIEPSTGLKLDASRIFYVGTSLGAMYGTMFNAIDPHVPLAYLNVGGGPVIDITRWSPAYHSLAQGLVARRVPSLLNAGTDYNENYVLRDQPAKVNNVAGAIAIQNFFEQLSWLQTSGDPMSYAPHLRLTPLPNVPAKQALLTYATGDQSVPNPQNSALIRAAGATIPDANAAFQKLLPFPSIATVFETPGLNLETLNFGTAATKYQPVMDRTPAIEFVASATGIQSSVQPNIQAGSWVAIYGSNLANGTADWTGLIGSGGQLPTSVGGVSVTLGGMPGYVYFVSPAQINVLAPETPPGDVPVVVSTQGVNTAPVTVHAATAAPAFFQLGASHYALATRYPDNRLVANPSIGTGYVAAKPGDILTLWATGFGPVTPAQMPGVLTSGLHNVLPLVTVTAAGASVTVIGAALSPGFAGLYQIAIQLPDTVPTGDVLLQARVEGFNTPGNVYLFIGQ